MFGIDRKRWYIEHTAHDPVDGVAYFGPFRKSQLTKELNSGYADLMAEVGTLDVVKMPDSWARKRWINSAKWWRSQ